MKRLFSATISFHLGAVTDLIEKVRANPECRDVKIMVGGYPFIVEHGDAVPWA